MHALPVAPTPSQLEALQQHVQLALLVLILAQLHPPAQPAPLAAQLALTPLLVNPVMGVMVLALNLVLGAPLTPPLLEAPQLVLLVHLEHTQLLWRVHVVAAPLAVPLAQVALSAPLVWADMSLLFLFVTFARRRLSRLAEPLPLVPHALPTSILLLGHLPAQLAQLGALHALQPLPALLAVSTTDTAVEHAQRAQPTPSQLEELTLVHHA